MRFEFIEKEKLRVNKISFLSTVWSILLLFIICILLIIVKIVRMVKISKDKTKEYKGDYMLLGLVIGMCFGSFIGTIIDSKTVLAWLLAYL